MTLHFSKRAAIVEDECDNVGICNDECERARYCTHYNYSGKEALLDWMIATIMPKMPSAEAKISTIKIFTNRLES